MVRQKMVDIRGDRSQAEIANLLDMSQQQYSNIENGKRGIRPKFFRRFEIVFNEKIENLAPDIFMPENTSKLRKHIFQTKLIKR